MYTGVDALVLFLDSIKWYCYVFDILHTKNKNVLIFGDGYAYYGAMYLKSPFWGVGCLATSERYAPGVAGGMLEDTGFFYGVVQLGVPIILFYIVIFFRGIYISIKLRRKNIADSRLCLSMTLLFVMFGINMDPFYAFALALPFYVSFVEYVRWNNVNETRSN